VLRKKRNTAVGDTGLCADRWENLVGGRKFFVVRD